MTINVATPDELQRSIATYLSQGYSLTSQEAETATLTKTAVKNLLSGNNIWIWVFLWFCFVIPALLYAAYILSQGDQVIIVHVDPVAAERDAAARQAALSSGGGTLNWSDDRRYWWNGTEWVDAQKATPPGVTYSDDQRQWWDGKTWRPVPGTAADVRPESSSDGDGIVEGRP